jgi:uncharacterized protein YggE
MNTKLPIPYIAVVGVLLIVIAGLFYGLGEQREMIYVNPSGGARLTIPGGMESLGSFGSAMAQVTEISDNTLFVSGSATASDNPDKVTISFSIETESLSALTSQQENARITADVRAALIAKGLDSDSITTTSYYLGQLTEYNSVTRKYESKGFKTTHSIKVELSEISRAGEIIDAAVSAGANRVSSVYFGLSASKTEDLRMDSLKSASENAREKAEAIAEGLGVTITRLISVSEGYSYTPVYRSYAMDATVAEGGGSSVPTEITPGDISVSSYVNAVFEIS